MGRRRKSSLVEPDKALHLAFITREAAKYPVLRWHYAACMPAGKVNFIGVWEHGRFIGAVLFGTGATPMLCRPYDLGPHEVCELVRVALRDHQTHVSRILKIAFVLLRQANPGLRLIVSFADPSRGHHGGIYQAGGWLFTGRSMDAKFAVKDGKLMHPRMIYEIAKRNRAKADAMPRVTVPGKFRYLMPLDRKIAKRVEHMRQPYPKQDDAKAAAAR